MGINFQISRNLKLGLLESLMVLVQSIIIDLALHNYKNEWRSADKLFSESIWRQDSCRWFTLQGLNFETNWILPFSWVFQQHELGAKFKAKEMLNLRLISLSQGIPDPRSLSIKTCIVQIVLNVSKFQIALNDWCRSHKWAHRGFMTTWDVWELWARFFTADCSLTHSLM